MNKRSNEPSQINKARRDCPLTDPLTNLDEFVPLEDAVLLSDGARPHTLDHRCLGHEGQADGVARGRHDLLREHDAELELEARPAPLLVLRQLPLRRGLFTGRR